MAASQIRGRILEALIKYYLSQHGYTIIPQNIQNYYGIERRGNGLNLKGRGAYHQIDALGQFQFIVPFVYPIRLLAESKCYTPRRYNRSMGLNKIRDFVGVVKDISENYFIEEYGQLEFKSRFRFTDSGVFFSTLPFSKDAEMYAYAQGIYLVPCPQILPFVDYIYNRMIQDRHFKNDINNFIRRLNEGEIVNINDLGLQTDTYRFSYFGMVMGWYPILISSRTEIPVEAFRNRDELNVRIGYRYLETEEQNRIVTKFEVRFNGWVGEFQIPYYVFAEYLKSMNFLEDMANMKERSLSYIDIPLIIGNIRRIIRLNLDIEWLNKFRQNIESNQRRQNE